MKVHPHYTLSAIALISLLTLTAASSYPTFKLSCAKGNTPAKCLNQAVVLEAGMAGYDKSPASSILEHPYMLPPIGEWHQAQTMISTNLGQMNVLSQTQIKCPKVKLEGVLTTYEIKCGQGRGGKCPYFSYVITVKKFSCLK